MFLELLLCQFAIMAIGLGSVFVAFRWILEWDRDFHRQLRQLEQDYYTQKRNGEKE